MSVPSALGELRASASAREARSLPRLRLPAIALLGVLAGCAPDQPPVSPRMEAAVLDVVVDSLPHVIERTWGVTDDGPYTTLLSAHAPEARALDPESADRREPPAEHPAAWLERQRAKEHVVGICSPAPDGVYCDPDRATVVATLSRVRAPSEGHATVEVALGRRDFGAIVELALDRTENAWTLTELSVIVIS